MPHSSGRLLSIQKEVRKKSGDKSAKVEIEISLDEADRRECIGTATYQEIKDYVWEYYQTKVSHLYIAQIKKNTPIIRWEFPMSRQAHHN